MNTLTPKQIVAKLDKYIVGQTKAKHNYLINIKT